MASLRGTRLLFPSERRSLTIKRAIRRLVRAGGGLALAGVLGGLFSVAQAATIDTELEGVSGAMADNVRAYLSLVQQGDLDGLSPWRIRRLARQAQTEARTALEPFGYYSPAVSVELEQPRAGESVWRARVTIDPGEPVIVAQVDIEIRGPGADAAVFRDWRDQWPLTAGERLDQRRYSEAKEVLPGRAEARGYLSARWLEHRIRVDRAAREARIEMVFATGPRAVLGEVEFCCDFIELATLERFRNFAAGDPYTAEAVEAFRRGLAGSGYFKTAVVKERRRLDADPPRVDLYVELEQRPRNSYFAGAGFGTDTGPRVQLEWDRHILNRHGDSLRLAVGAQQEDSEFNLRGEYRRPRGHDGGDFWFVDARLQQEDDDLRFRRVGADEAVFPAFDGSRRKFDVSGGVLSQATYFGDWPVERRVFMTFLNEKFDALDTGAHDPFQQRLLDANPALRPELQNEQVLAAAGFSWEIRQLRGSGFETRGTRAQMRVLGSVDGVASDTCFLQTYLGISHNRLLGERHKLLFNGEIGYTEASVREFTVALDDRSIDLSITELPERYRFKTGGDRSVRGYGYEALSNNRNGSNHLLTASAEYEYRVTESWSAAVFVDAGNAFNDFGDPSLRTGIGLGVRYYTLIGPVRLDLAQARDIAGKPLRIHLTIGAPLLSFGSDVL